MQYIIDGKSRDVTEVQKLQKKKKLVKYIFFFPFKTIKYHTLRINQPDFFFPPPAVNFAIKNLLMKPFTSYRHLLMRLKSKAEWAKMRPKKVKRLRYKNLITINKRNNNNNNNIENRTRTTAQHRVFPGEGGRGGEVQQVKPEPQFFTSTSLLFRPDTHPFKGVAHFRMMTSNEGRFEPGGLSSQEFALQSQTLFDLELSGKNERKKLRNQKPKKVQR